MTKSFLVLGFWIMLVSSAAFASEGSSSNRELLISLGADQVNLPLNQIAAEEITGGKKERKVKLINLVVTNILEP